METQVSPATGDAALVIGALLASLSRIETQLSEQSPNTVFADVPNAQELHNWPASGGLRKVVPARGIGSGIIAIASTSATDVLPADGGRAGLSLINYGNGPVFVYLCRAGDVSPGARVLWVSGNGGSWDGKVSGELWAGAVSVALAAAGSTSLALAVI
jgi:hypothetical protein